MTEAELAALIERAPAYDELVHYGGRSAEAEEMLCAIERAWAAAVPALIAELRRLRAELERRTPYGGQGYVTSAGQYVDGGGRSHPLPDPTKAP